MDDDVCVQRQERPSTEPISKKTGEPRKLWTLEEIHSYCQRKVGRDNGPHCSPLRATLYSRSTPSLQIYCVVKIIGHFTVVVPFVSRSTSSPILSVPTRSQKYPLQRNILWEILSKIFMSSSLSSFVSLGHLVKVCCKSDLKLLADGCTDFTVYFLVYDREREC